MGKDKLRKFAENETFACFVQPEFDTVFRCDHPLKGNWRRDFFHNTQPIILELGCGKGVSTAAMVYDNQDVNFIAMDITCNVLGDTRRNIAKTYGDEPVKNAMITRYNIEDIRKVFAPEDRVERIYINF